MKWLFLLASSAVGSAVVVALSGIIAGKGALGGLELFSRQPAESSLLLAFLLLEWALLSNDIAASKGLSRILGYSVEFREVRTYAGESDQLIPLRTKLCIVHPVFMTGYFAVFAIQISRL